MGFVAAAFVAMGSKKIRCEDRVRLLDEVVAEGGAEMRWFERGLVAVADGVGGSRDGGFAAAYVVGALDPASLSASELDAINLALVAETERDPERRGAATTLAAIELSPGGLRLFSVGDSEVWLARHGRLVRVNDDQSTENGVVTSWFGGDDLRLEVSTESVVDQLVPGDRLLICSDGLRKCVGRDELRTLLGVGDALDAAFGALRDRVCVRARPDDVSFVLVQVSDQPTRQAS
jgi:serine/threonine protein phosphatase PrpC